jgi:ankyrin repeat protein
MKFPLHRRLIPIGAIAEGKQYSIDNVLIKKQKRGSVGQDSWKPARGGYVLVILTTCLTCLCQIGSSTVIAKDRDPAMVSEELRQALKAHDFDAVKAALQAGGSPHMLDDDEDILSSYLLRGVPHGVFESPPSARAIAVARLKLIQLIDAGADPDFRPPNTPGPLSSAGILNEEWAVKILVERGASPNAVYIKNRNPLLSALRGPNYSEAARITIYLLAKGANPNIQTSDDGMTPLMQAAEDGNTVAVRALLCHGALTDTTSTDGRSALEYATVTNENGPRSDEKREVQKLLSDKNPSKKC